MKTPKDKNPVNSNLPVTVIDRFLEQQEQLIRLLEQAVKVDLARTKTGTSLSRFIRLRLGDTLRFVVFHIERHTWQAQKVF